MRRPAWPFGRARRSDKDFADEIAAHLALEADRLAADGFSGRDAILEARRRFGNVGMAQERFHEHGRVAVWDAYARHAKAAMRRLRRSPAFSITAALTLALGIGATTAVFSLVDGVLLRPLPYPRPDRLVEITHTITLQGVTTVDQSDATYLYYARANHVFTDVGAYRTTAVNLADAGAAPGTRATRVQAAQASASVFRLLAVPPIEGRTFADAEDLPEAAPVVVLSEALWRTAFSGDRGILGRKLLIDGVPHQVVGIMPAAFTFPDQATQLWLPIGVDPARTESATFDLHAIGRLRDGATISSATQDLMPLLPRVPEAFPGRLTAQGIALTKMRPVVRPLTDVVLGNVGGTIWVVFAAAAFLLLIACANVGNLFLVRAEERQHELAVRRALGAGRASIAAEFLSEAAGIALLAGALGITLAWLAVTLMHHRGAALSIPRLGAVGMSLRVLLGAVAATVATMFVVSAAPLLRFAAPANVNALAHRARGRTAGREHHRMRRAFVVAQVGLGLVLIAGAGLMARSFAAMKAVPIGFDATGAYTARIALPPAEYPSSEAAFGVISRALEALSPEPGIAAAGAITRIPLDSEARQDSGTWVEDRLPRPGQLPNVHQVAFASPAAFTALGVPMVQGREFRSLDPVHPAAEAIVTRALARRYWGDSLATGRHIGFSPVGPWFTIVGVTGDIRGSGPQQPPDETVYLPLVVRLNGGMAAMGSAGVQPRLWTPRNVGFVVRSSQSAAATAAPVSRAIAAVAPGVPLYKAESLDRVVALSRARTSFTAALLELASLVALLIAAVGLYGMMTYVVGLRRKELAVRVALGASAAVLRRRVVAEAAAVAAVGVVLGVGATLALVRFMASMLFGVAPRDPVTLSTSAVLMLIVAVVASWLPARRAASIAPAEALRSDA